MESRESARLEAFSDAVIAISITLLGLDLKVPLTFDKSTLLHSLVEQWPVYLAFLVSFFTLLMMWYIHSVYFRFIIKLNREIFYANGLILMLTISIPFVTRMVAEYMQKDSAPTAIIIYTGFGPLVSLAYFWLIDAIFRAKSVHNPAVPFFAIKKVKRKISFGPPAYTLAFLLAFFVPFIALAMCMMINVYWGFTRLHYFDENKAAI
jgi:uncharacterized membrane protein